MTKLVINSDDFGYSKGINLGIIETFKEGVLSSTTMMANMPGFDQAKELAKEYPDLGIGVHLSLTCGRPVLKNVDELVGENGYFHSLKHVKETASSTNLDQLYEEWKAQINKVKQADIEVTHLDTHHYSHGFGEHYTVIENLAKEFNLPIRNCLGVKDKLQTPDIAPADDFWNLFNYPSMKEMTQTYDKVRDDLFAIVEKDAKKYAAYDKVEAVCHPGYVDTQVLFGSSFNLARLREIEILTDVKMKDLLREYGFVICRYDEF